MRFNSSSTGISQQQQLPAVFMLLKHDFWSILGQRTYRAFGRWFLNVNKHSISVIPVAIGTTKADAVEWTPEKYQLIMVVASK